MIADHELVRPIGAGGYGEVWLVRGVTGVLRAAKVVWRARFDHERLYEREFTGLTHFEPISRLHPGLMDVLQIGRDDQAGYFYYVIELADGADGAGAEYVPLTLGELLARRGRLPVAEVARFGARVAEALEFLHAQGLVHRDVKPSNIIFVDGQPKLADIGLVTGRSAARSFVGTEGYIPPEGPGTPRSDIYSLGKVLYELATGRNRLDFPDLPADLMPQDGQPDFGELNEIILRACAAEAEGRHRSAEELRGELLLVDAGRSVRRLRRNERLLTRWRQLAVGALVLGAFGIGAVLWERARTERALERVAAETAQRQLIAEKELAARQNLYAADMNLAQQAIEHGNFGRAEGLLNAYVPAAGETDLRGFEWFHYWHLAQGDNVGVLRGHADVVSSLLLSPDGERLFSAGFDSTIREWSLADRRELRRWTLPGCLIMSLAADAAGTHLAVEGGNRPMSGVLDLAAGRWATNVSSASPRITFSPSGDRLVRGARMLLFETDGVVEVTDRSLRVERVLEGAGGRAWFSPDGRLLATGPWGRSVRFWTWPGLEPAGELPDVGVVMDLAFSPDGTRLATGTREGRLAVWDVAGRRRLEERQVHDGSIVWSVAFSPDGIQLASGGNDQTVRLWNAGTLTEGRVFRGHGSEVWSVLWTRDGRRLISAGKDRTIRLWNASPPPRPLELTNVAQSVVFSPDERMLAVRQRGEAGVRVWDLAGNRFQLELGAAEELGGFSADGRSVTLLRAEGAVERRDAADGRLLEAHAGIVPGGEFTRRLLSPDGRWLVTGHEDGAVRVIDVAQGGPPRRLDGHNQMISALELSPDGRQLLTGSLDRTACLWDLATGTRLHRLAGHRMAVGSGAFSADGRLLATGSWDDTVRLWDTGTWRDLGVLEGHANSVHDLVFAPGGRTLAVLSGAGVLKFWSLGAEREAGMLQLDQGTRLGTLAISPGGRWLAAVSPAGRLTVLPGPRSAPADR